MWELVSAFATLIAIASVGYAAGRLGALRSEDQVVLSRLAFYVTTPALLFSTVAESSLDEVFSGILITNVVGIVVVQILYAVAAVLVWRRHRSESVIGTLAASYVNAGNLGLPLALYVLGDAALIAPIALFQMLVMAPAAFMLLDNDRDPEARPRLLPALGRTLRNPLVIASLLGLLVALLPVGVPTAVMRPIELVAAAAVPVALIAYGLSLMGSGPLLPHGAGPEVGLILALKVIVQPTVAYLVGRFGLGLEGAALLPVTLLAALPTAQNVYVYALHYRTAISTVRAAVLLTTLTAVPVMLVIAGLLG